MDDEVEPIVYSKPPEMRRVCLLYLDILGYKQFVDIHKDKAYVLIDKTFQTAKLFMKNFNTLLDVDKIKFKGYSDNLILSTELDGVIEDYLIYHDMILLSALLQDTAIVICKLQFRGAVTAGYCLIDDYIYGDPFMEAHRLESEVADWGRVMVSEEIVNALRPYDNVLSHRIIEDQGGFYIDFLRMTNNPATEENYKHNTELLVESFIFMYQLALYYYKDIDTLGRLNSIAKIIHKNDKMLTYISGFCKENHLENLLNDVFREKLFYERMVDFENKYHNATEDTAGEVMKSFQLLVEALPYYRKSLQIAKESLKKHDYLDLTQYNDI